MNFMAFIERFTQDRRGATAIEYGLIAALISVVIIGTLAVTGTQLNDTFNFVATTLQKI